ncbi:uncharacterized protein [Salminus brasiliensis]|uniref:uncharacterized protein n=1 Tax=Salminus brasiliensis TaxID=930266 RepID=UPI003B83925F
MSAAPHNDTLQPGSFSGSAQTPASRPPASSRDPSTSKRVCFYKSGDPQFSGHRVVINSRTFKTFDALLDALSKKVPLPFGVRTITTPKGTHAVRSLDDLRDGASYLCSDQRRVKPLNLEEINRRQVPWNTTRPASSGRHGRRGLIRQLIKKNEVRKAAKGVESAVTVWTPKRLVVYKNRDPSTRRTIVLQRRTAPTFQALLDYLSQVLQFPVVKLYTADGIRVDGLPALILCSGIVVAAGNEPFWLGNYNLQGSSQPSKSAVSESIGSAKTHALPTKKKSPSSRSRSRNFSLSSERYFIDQINKSLSGSLSEDNGQNTGSTDPENNQPLESDGVETSDCVAGIEEKEHFVMPSEDDIEKSFCVNQDGSMTVEMKVRLTIKHEEMIHWTTTLSRTCANSQQRAVRSQPGYNSPENKNCSAKEAKRHTCESSEDNTNTEKSAGEDHCGSATSEALAKPKPALRRLPTPGPRHVRRKEASVENIKRVSQNEVQESTVGAYSYMERTAEGELTEGYCVVSRSSSSSTRPVPKPRKGSSGEAKHKRTHSSVRSSRMAEVLQLQNNGTEVTETVMHIYESQGMCENYFANTQVTADKGFEFRANAKEPRKPDSTDSGPRSSSNDCDVDLTRQSTSSDSQNARKNELLSLSSGQSSPSQKIKKSPSSCTNSEKRARPKSSQEGLEDHKVRTKENPEKKGTENRKAKTPKSERSKEGTSSDTTVSDKKQKGSVPGSLKDLGKSKSPESQSHTGSEKKTVSSAESETIGQKIKKKKKEKQSPKLDNPKGSSETDQNQDSTASQKSPKSSNICHRVTSRDSCQTDTPRAPIKKKHLDVLPPSHLAPFKMLAKPRSMNECRIRAPKESKELTESISMPVLHSSPSNVHQYVENWLKKIQPESVPYMDEMDQHEAETAARPKFWIGSGSADSSEIRSEPEQDGVPRECPSLEDSTEAIERPLSRPPVQIRCEGEPVETQRIRGFCKSMPSVRIHPAEQESHMRMHRSSEALVTLQPDAEGETSQGTKVNTRTGVKPVLQQLCLSIQSIRRTSSHSNLTTLEKERSSSLPDFSSQVASVFGSPSKALLSFLSLMTLKDGISSPSNEDPLSNSGSYPEALHVMQSLEKIANIEDEEEVKASLTSLQSSTSSQLKQSWRDFQDRNDTEGTPPLSPRQSEQEFALEVDSEGEDHDKEHNFGIEELMDELNMSEDLRREISSLVDGDQTGSEKAKLTKKPSGNELTDNDLENEVAATKDDFLVGEGGYSEDRASQDDIARVEEAGGLQSEQLHRVESCPPEPALLDNDPVMEESEIVENDTCQPDPIVQSGDEKYTENITCQEDMLEVPDPTQNDIEEEKKEEEDAELHAYTSETDGVDVSEHHGQDCETEKGAESQEGDVRETDLDEHIIHTEEEDAYQETREDPEQPEAEEYELDENQEAEHQNNIVIPEDDLALNEEANMSDEEEQTNDTFRSEDAEAQRQDPSAANCNSESRNSHGSEVGNEKLALESPSALECSADEADLETNDNGPMEEEDGNDNEGRVSDQGGVESDQTEKGSCKSQESDSKQKEFQTLQEESDVEKQSSAEEKCEEEDGREDEQSNALDSGKDVDSELESNDPEVSDQEGDHCDQSKLESCKSQDSEVLQMVEEERVEKDEEADRHEYKHCNALDSEEDFEIEPNDHTMSDQDKTQSCKSQESEVEHELHTPDEGNVTPEEADENEDKQSNASDSDRDFDAEPEAISSARSDQGEEHSDQDKTQSCKSQESEVEHELHTPDEGNVTPEETGENEDKQSNVLDSDRDFDAEPEAIDSAMSDHCGHQSDQDKAQSCKSQESDVEHKLETLEDGNITEENEEVEDEHEDKQSIVLDSDKDLDTEPEAIDSAMSDQPGQHSDQDNTQSCKSRESDVEHELHTLEDGNVTEENEEVEDEHEDKQSMVLDSDKDLDTEPEAVDSAMSDQHSQNSDQDKTQSCKSQESDVEHELHTLEDGNVTEENEEGVDEREDKQSIVLDSDKDLEAEPEAIDSAMSDQPEQHSDQDNTQSCKSRESDVEHELHTLEDGNVTEENEEGVDEHEDKQSIVLDSDKDLDAEPEAVDSAMSDQPEQHSDQDNTQSCKSRESDLKTLEDENEEDVDEHEDKQCNALDSLDSEAEPEANSPAMSDQDGEHYHKNKSESCESRESEGDADTEADCPAVSDQMAVQESSKSQESGDEQEPPTKVQETMTKTTSDEENEGDNDDDDYDDAEERDDQQNNAFVSDKDVDAESDYSYMPDPEIKQTVRREPCKSQEKRGLKAQSDEIKGSEKADVSRGCYCVPPMEISQELLDFVNLALLSSALTFTHDSNGHMRIEPDRCKITEVCDDQYVQRCLPSPSMSDLSDYRPETSDSGGDLSQVSSDLYTETGEEEVEKLSVYPGSVRQSSRNAKRRDKTLNNGLTHAKRKASPSFKSINSSASFQDSLQEPAYSNSSGSLNGDSEPVQCAVFHTGLDSSEGVLIDKGRWLLKENHLIRKSPPVPMGMYENADTTSADTGQDNTSEDAPYTPCRSQHAPLAVISSSELEELAKPPTPKCTYFNMPHSSDSDPFQDSRSVNSCKAADVRKSRELKVSPMGETPSKTWAKKNGSLPSFASVEFKLPDGKVHPEAGLESGAVEKTARSQSVSGRAAQEEESVEELNLRCGRHCPIL